MSQDTIFSSYSSDVTKVKERNAVLRNSFILLAGSVGLAAISAILAINVPAFAIRNPIVFLIGAYGLMFLVNATSKSGLGILSMLGFSTFMGLSLAPILMRYINIGAGEVIVQAFITTAAVFVGLSAYVMQTKKDFSHLSGIALILAIVLIVSMVIGIFIKSTVFSLLLSAGFAIFACLTMMITLSNIVRNGETNYIMATLSLFTSIYNLFVSLLSLLGSNRE